MLTPEEYEVERDGFLRRHAERLSAILGRKVEPLRRLRPIETRATRDCRDCGASFIRAKGSNTPYCALCRGRRRASARATERLRLRQRCYAAGRPVPPLVRECVACGERFEQPVRKGRSLSRCSGCRS